MELLTKPASTYLLIITRRNASEILLLRAGSGWTLPRVEVDPEQRLAEQLTAQAARVWHVEACCLFERRVQEGALNTQPRWMVMESAHEDEKAKPGTHWMPRSVAEHCCDAPDGAAIGESLAELNGYSKAQAAGRFACCGWLRELFRWTQEQIAPRGMRLTGAFRQLNAGPTFNLIRFETDEGAVWFKATGEPNSHELAVTVALARFLPRFVPEILGIYPAWNGWLSKEAPGTALDEIGELVAWERAAEELAKLQIASIGKTEELLEARARDLRIPKLAAEIHPFVARMGELMAAQAKHSPLPLDHSELKTLAEALRESCAVLESLHLPDTLGHTDCNPGNILVSEERAVFLDWAETAVTNPLVSLQYLCEYMVRSGVGEPAGSEKLTNAYLRPWEKLHSPAELRQALALTPLVAVFAYAVAADSWRTLNAANDARLAAYYRSLARRMFREAAEVTQRSEVCLD